METASLKNDLLDKIEHADDEQIMKLYGLVTNYLNSQVELEEWDLMPDYQKERITESIKQADAGLVRPVSEMLKSTKEKYGLNG